MARKNIITTKTVSTLFLTVILGSATYVWLVKPELARLNSAVGSRDQLRRELVDIDKKKELLGLVEASYEQIQQDIQKLEIAIPDDSNTGEYVAAIEALANETGVRITNLHTSIQAKRAPVKTNTDDAKAARQKATVKKTLEEELLTMFYNTGVELKTESNYEQLYSFITRALNLDRFTVLSSLNMSTSTDGSIISSTLSFNIYHRNES